MKSGMLFCILFIAATLLATSEAGIMSGIAAYGACQTG